MSDGCRLAVDVHLPLWWGQSDMPAPPLPTILHLTRYNRNFAVRPAWQWLLGPYFNMRSMRYVATRRATVIVGWFLGSLVPWFLGSLVPWFLGSLVPWLVDIRMARGARAMSCCTCHHASWVRCCVSTRMGRNTYCMQLFSHCHALCLAHVVAVWVGAVLDVLCLGPGWMNASPDTSTR